MNVLQRVRGVHVAVPQPLDKTARRKMRRTFNKDSNTTGILLLDSLDAMERAYERAVLDERARLKEILLREFMGATDTDFNRGYTACAEDAVDLMEKGR